jgi:hypothetical protein
MKKAGGSYPRECPVEYPLNFHLCVNCTKQLPRQFNEGLTISYQGEPLAAAMCLSHPPSLGAGIGHLGHDEMRRQVLRGPVRITHYAPCRGKVPCSGHMNTANPEAIIGTGSKNRRPDLAERTPGGAATA